MTTSEGQAFCLRWNNHKSNLVEVLDALIQKECYVDCTIVVDGQVQFKAHRVVLAANSPYFQSILQDVPMDHCSILFPGVQPFEMRALLDYMYTGEVNVTQSQIPKIMKIAEQLEVKGLFDMTDLKEKFNKFDETATIPHHHHHHIHHQHQHQHQQQQQQHQHQHQHQQHYQTSVHTPISTPPIYVPSNISGSCGGNSNKDGNGRSGDSGGGGNDGGCGTSGISAIEQQQSSSSMISTSSNVTPAHSSSSPPYTPYKSPFSNIHSKSPGPSTSDTKHTQWPLTAHLPRSLLSSVYESGTDMNPLKRKKLHSISSMLMYKDTPILRNVLQPHSSVDSSQSVPQVCPQIKPERSEKRESGNCNGKGDYSADKKLKYEEPNSPYTDKSFEDDGLDCPPSYPGDPQLPGYAQQQQQKPEWKRYKQYTRTDILSAIECVRNGMSALQASRKYGVPSRTLYDKVKKLGITAGRPMNRTLKRSPSNGGNSANFPFSIGGSNNLYGSQNEQLLSQMHESQLSGSERDKDREHSHLQSTIPHPAAALLDPSFLQQALEGRGGDIAGREALHAMALVAAAHSAVNGMSTSPGANGSTRSPSPGMPVKYIRSQSSPPSHMKCEIEQIDDDEDRVEDLSIGRKEIRSPSPQSQQQSQQQPQRPQSSSPLPPTSNHHSYNISDDRHRSESPISESPHQHHQQRQESNNQLQQPQQHQQTGVIVPPMTKLSSNNANNDEYNIKIEPNRECITTNEDSRD